MRLLSLLPLIIIALQVSSSSEAQICAVDLDCKPLMRKLTTNEKKAGRYLCVDKVCRYTVAATQLCNVAQDCAAFVYLSRELGNKTLRAEDGPSDVTAWLSTVCSADACNLETECSASALSTGLYNSTSPPGTARQCCRGLEESWTCSNLAGSLDPCEHGTTCDTKLGREESSAQCTKDTEKSGLWIGIVLTLVGSAIINLGLNLQRYALIRAERKKYNKAHGLSSSEGSFIGNLWRKIFSKGQPKKAFPNTLRPTTPARGTSLVTDDPDFQDVELKPTDTSVHAETQSQFAKHNYNAAEVLQRKFSMGQLVRNKFWLFAFGVFALGNVFHFVALKYAPQSVIGPVASFSLVVNVVMAPWINKESLQKRDVVGIFLIVVGGTLVAVFSGHSSDGTFL